MFGIGMPELVLILVIALIVIGPDKLPDLARAIGRGIGEFRKATDGLKASIDQDDELRNLKKSLTEARDEMSNMVRQQTQGLKVEEVAEALADGTFFEKKTVDAEGGEQAAEDREQATSELVAETEARAEDAAQVNSEIADSSGETAPPDTPDPSGTDETPSLNEEKPEPTTNA